jgi:hypothetical protein
VPVHRHDEVAPPEQFAELHAPVRSAAGLAVGVDDLHAAVRGAPRDLGILDGCHGMVIGAT